MGLGILLLIFGPLLFIATFVYLLFAAKKNIRGWIKFNIVSVLLIFLFAWNGELIPHELFMIFFLFPLIVWSPLLFITAGWNRGWPAIYPMICCAALWPTIMLLPQIVGCSKLFLYYKDYQEVVKTFQAGKWPYGVSNRV